MDAKKNEVLLNHLRSAGCNVESGTAAPPPGEDKRVAVIGYSCILPGSANVTEAWDTISQGLDQIRELPADRVDVTAYFHPEKTTKDKIYCTRGGFIPNFDFNPREFNFNMLQMEDTDVNQTLSLVKVKEALQDAGIEANGTNKKNIGCVLGIGGGQKASHEFYSRLNYVVVEKVLRKIGMPEADVQAAVEKYKNNFPEWRLDSFPGFLGNVASGRVTNVFNLDGMNAVVDAACASSLVAIKVAIDELMSGNCRTMIAGATCTDCSIGMFMSFSKTPVFSLKQSVTAYDKDTGGMLIGEGSVMFVLKKYSDAVEDGDRIHAIIRGCASSSDGKAPGIYAPTILGQELAIRRAYKNSGVDPATVSLVEGHGTGTPVGDAIELTALKNVLGEGDARKRDPRRQRVAVGSIKSNIGHLKAVAGCAGLVKAILALKHKILPKTINVHEPPDLRDGTTIQESALYINTRQRPWFTVPGLPRRAGVSSFGFGGANYHCVVEEAESDHTTKSYRTHALSKPVIFSSSSKAGLKSTLKAEMEALAKASQPVLNPKTKVSAVDKKAVAKAFDSFAVKYKLRPIPAQHARCGFLVNNSEEGVATISAVLKELGSNNKSTWSLSHVSAFFREQGLQSADKVAALFPNQGSEYTYMLDEVAMNWPEFRTVVNAVNEAHHRALPDQAMPSEVMYPRAKYDSEEPLDMKEISQPTFAQPAVAAASLGIFEVLKSAGLKASFVGGHSLGELVALSAAEVIDHATLSELVCARVSGAAGFKRTLSAALNRFKASGSAIPFNSASASPYTSNDAILQALANDAQVDFGKTVQSMYDHGARVFIEFGPQASLTATAEKVLRGKDVVVVATNASSARSSEVQLREAAVQLSVAGVPLSNFDPWAEDDPYLLGFPGEVDNPKLKRGTLSLSAATFVSAGTIKRQQKVMNDGYKITGNVVKSESPSPATVAAIERKVTDAERREKLALKETEKLKAELAATKKALADSLASSNTLSRPPSLDTRLSPPRLSFPLGPSPRSSLASGTGFHGPEPPAKFMKYGAAKGPKSTLSWHPLAGKNGNPTPGFQPTAFPPRAITFIPFPNNPNDNNHEPGVLPLSWVNLTEFMCNKVSLCLGDEFKRFDDSTTSRSPAFDLQMCTRVLSVTGMEKGSFYGVDVNPAKGTMVAEFDCPADAWFFKASSNDGLMPYSILMEIGLQTSGILTSWVKAPLTMNRDNILFRNLDATAKLLFNPDLRGKTITNTSRCTGYSMLGSMAIHRFICELSVDGKVFYEVNTSFGWFVPEVFEKQVGLDNGKPRQPWYLEQQSVPSNHQSLNVPADTEPLFESFPGLQRRSEQVNFLDHVDIIPNSGKYELGYAYGSKKVNKEDWFFSCHFWCDPVMPGSLGIEAMFQCIEFHCVQTQLGKGLANPRFNHDLGETKWKYRGQLTPKNNEMGCEVHIKSVKKIDGGFQIVADGFLFVDGLRTYEASDLRLQLVEGEAPKVSSSSAVPPALFATHVVLDVIAAKTGYELDLIEFDLDLELELGIDSIKRFEILNEVQNTLGVRVRDIAALSRTRTVGEVMEVMIKELKRSDSSPRPSAPTVTSPVTSSPDFETSVDDAHNTAPEISLNFVDTKKIKAPRTTLYSCPRNRPVIVVDDGTSLTPALAARLGTERSVVVLSHQGFHSNGLQSDIPRFTIPNRSEDELQKVLKDIESQSGAPSAFIFQFVGSESHSEQLGWALMAAKFLSPSLQTPINAGRASFLSVVRMDGKLGIADGASHSSGTLQDIFAAQRGAAFGLCKTLDLEWPTVHSRGIDISQRLDSTKAAEFVFQELYCTSKSVREVGYAADGQRYTTVARDLSHAQAKESSPRAVFSSEDVLLVTGGGRGITPLCIAQLARRVHGGTYLLLGRSKIIDEPAWANGKSGKDLEKAAMAELKRIWKLNGPKPTPREHKKLVALVRGSREVRESLELISAAGGRAHYYPCDVSSLPAIKNVIRSVRTDLGLTITGIFHASGVLRDKLVEDKTLADFNMVFGVKVAGLENILKALQNQLDDLRHLVVFSSLAGAYGNPAQSDYSMANEALSKMVHRFEQAYPGCRGRALCFGPWDGGMVTAALKAHFQSMGVQIIPRDGGAKQVSALLTLPGPGRAQVLVGNWAVEDDDNEDEEVSSEDGLYSLEKEIEWQLMRQRNHKTPVMWNYEDLLQYAEGDIAPIFNKYKSGEHPPWELVDSYPIRVRLPQREYLLVSRVTKMEATTGVYGPCHMTTEYDIPVNGTLSEGGDVPWAVLVESGQCDLMLISYLGIDFQNEGVRSYRLLDTTLTFFGVAKEGETLVYDISINNYAKKEGKVSMMFFSYNCYVNGKLLIEMRNGVAGFFTKEDLDAGKGVVHTKNDLKLRQKIQKQDINKYTFDSSSKSSFSESEMQYLSVHGSKGWGSIVPEAINVNYKLCARKMLMIDRITHVLPSGGAYGLGVIVGEKILERDDWYFPCHFKNDEVMAGSLVSDGCSQMLKVYMILLGLQNVVTDFQFRPVNGVNNKVRCRGQISPHKGKLVYVMEIKEIGFNEKTGFPFAIANVDIIDVDFEKGQSFDFNDLDLYGRGDLSRKIVVDFKGIALQIEGEPNSRHPTRPKATPSLSTSAPSSFSSSAALTESSQELGATLLNLNKGFSFTAKNRTQEFDSICPRDLGDQGFMDLYGVDYPIYTGAMAKGIASADLVIAAGKRKMLASLGAGGLPPHVVEANLKKIQAALPNGPFAVNLIHSPADDILEKTNVDLFLKYGVRVVEASAFMSLTKHVVRYRLAGLRKGTNGQVICDNKIIYKVSRTELAELAMRPAPKNLVDKLLKEGSVTPEQAELSQFVPMCDDVAVEADSGGHTDNRPLHVILPLIIATRNRIQAELNFPTRVRVGAGGGIGCPEAVLAAFRMGAAFVVTGTVNQMSHQAGTCDNVRSALSKAKYSDITMAPAADMFDQGVKLQVLKTGTMFPARAKKLWDLFCQFDSLDALPPREVAKLEKSTFKKSIEEVWQETISFHINQLGDHEKIANAERDPKLKMSLVFRWYLGLSSFWANSGAADRVYDYQVWCGPAIGSFNEFIKASYLDPKVANAYPCVVQINLQLLHGACYLSRLSQISACFRKSSFTQFQDAYTPSEPL